jgi:hypothetical protein
MVLATLPSDGLTDVPTSSDVAVAFDSAMNPLGGEHFSLREGGSNVLGVIHTSSDGRTLTFNPATDLAPGRTFEAVVRSGATSRGGLGLASDYRWHFTTGVEADRTSPQVSSTAPTDGMTGVATNQALLATFSEGMDPASIGAAEFSLTRGGTPIAGTVAYSGIGATFTPSQTLEPNTLYRAEIGPNAADLAGNRIAAGYAWSFTTGDSPDAMAPTIVANTPRAGSVGVPLNQRISITFSEPMAPTSITAATFTLRVGAQPVVATITYSGISAVLAPWELLDENTEFTATLSTAATDLAGNAIQSAHEWRFTTGTAFDTTAPLVASTTPINNAIVVEVDQVISAIFSEQLDPATVTTTSVTLIRGTTPVAGTVSYSGVTAVFDPSTSLVSATTYRVAIAPSVTDLAGNPLAVAFGWSFTTGGEAHETDAPTVFSTDPGHGAVGVPINQTMSLTFSEAMDPASISAATFTLRRGATPIAATVTYLGVTARLTPWELLAYDTEYALTMSTGAADLAGNALESAHEWRFTTAGEPDTVAPVVVSSTPLAGAINAEVDVLVSVTFSEPMAGATVNTTSLTIRRGGAPIMATVTYSGVVALLLPWEVLSYATEYAVTLSTAATDLAGNPLQSAREWRFTTGTAPDTTAPTLVARVPAHLDGNVQIAQSVTATFSEALDASTITTTSMTLHRGDSLVAATVTYAGVAATLTPLVPLEYGTEYTMALGANIADLSGNLLGTTSNWRFTTRTAPDTTAPTLVTRVPAHLDGNVQIAQSVTATFSEALDASTITTTSMTLHRGGSPVAATVTYAGVDATLTPLVPLEYGTEYTMALGANIADLSGNLLGTTSNWRFTTRIAPDTTAPQVVSASPPSGALGAATTAGVVVSFSEAMSAASVTSASFRVSDELADPVPGTTSLDQTGMVATFSPTADLLRGSTYHVALSVALRDVAGNPLAAAAAWEFTTAAGPAPVLLGTAANYVILARTGIATTGVSDVTGNLGLSPGVDAVLMGWGQSAATTFSTSPMVDGHIHVSTYDAPTPEILVLASNDMGAAYSAAAALGPPDAVGLNAGALGGVTFEPGIYRWDAAATIATNVTIAGGPNDVWVFQINGALAMAASVSVVLSGGARAENVFWQVNGAINIGATSHFEGIAMASTAINVGAGSSVNGRLLAQTAVSVDTCEVGLSSP